MLMTSSMHVSPCSSVSLHGGRPSGGRRNIDFLDDLHKIRGIPLMLMTSSMHVCPESGNRGPLTVNLWVWVCAIPVGKYLMVPMHLSSSL